MKVSTKEFLEQLGTAFETKLGLKRLNRTKYILDLGADDVVGLAIGWSEKPSGELDIWLHGHAYRRSVDAILIRGLRNVARITVPLAARYYSGAVIRLFDAKVQPKGTIDDLVALAQHRIIPEITTLLGDDEAIRKGLTDPLSPPEICLAYHLQKQPKLIDDRDGLLGLIEQSDNVARARAVAFLNLLL